MNGAVWMQPDCEYTQHMHSFWFFIFISRKRRFFSVQPKNFIKYFIRFASGWNHDVVLLYVYAGLSANFHSNEI